MRLFLFTASFAVLISHFVTPSLSMDTFACFNSLLHLACNPAPAPTGLGLDRSTGQDTARLAKTPVDDVLMLVFDAARYGRNDSSVASRCDVTYSRHCDVDVHFHLNRACAGRRKCKVAVTSSIFGESCGGQDGFITVAYRCVRVTSVDSICRGSSSDPLSQSGDRSMSRDLNRGWPLVNPNVDGFISSPNYPDRYYPNANCTWIIRVQPRQAILVTLFDFELDVRRSTGCVDALHVFGFVRGRGAGGKGGGGGRGDDLVGGGIRADDLVEYFNDCGVLGKQTIEVKSSVTVVRFTTGQTGLPQRGFLLHYRAIGPGCAEIPPGRHSHTTYYLETVRGEAEGTGNGAGAREDGRERVGGEGSLMANTTCDLGHEIFSTLPRDRTNSSSSSLSSSSSSSSSLSSSSSSSSSSLYRVSRCLDRGVWSEIVSDCFPITDGMTYDRQHKQQRQQQQQQHQDLADQQLMLLSELGPGQLYQRGLLTPHTHTSLSDVTDSSTTGGRLLGGSTSVILPASFIGLVFGIASATSLLLLALLLAIVASQSKCHSRRVQQASGHPPTLQRWQMVINNHHGGHDVSVGDNTGRHIKEQTPDEMPTTCTVCEYLDVIGRKSSASAIYRMHGKNNCEISAKDYELTPRRFSQNLTRIGDMELHQKSNIHSDVGRIRTCLNDPDSERYNLMKLSADGLLSNIPNYPSLLKNPNYCSLLKTSQYHSLPGCRKKYGDGIMFSSGCNTNPHEILTDVRAGVCEMCRIEAARKCPVMVVTSGEYLDQLDYERIEMSGTSGSLRCTAGDAMYDPANRTENSIHQRCHNSYARPSRFLFQGHHKMALIRCSQSAPDLPSLARTCYIPR